MNGVNEPLAAQAIEPLHPGDHRPDVHELIRENRLAIDKLAEALRNSDDPLYQPSKHDDLWILRFVLSHKGKHKASLKAIRHTLQYRQEMGWDGRDIRYRLPGTSNVDCPALLEIQQYSSADTFLWCLPHGDLGTVCMFSRYAGYDQHSLIANVDECKWQPAFSYFAEWAFQWCDYITRTTGRLTKNLRLIDFAGMSFRDNNSELSRRDSKAMSYTEDCYPQLLQGVIICHGPTWITAVWRLIRPLLPKRLTEKVDFMNPTANETDRQRLRTLLPAEVLPERFGGEYQPWPVQFEPPKQRC
jgi:CRAL/TRIO domain